MNFLRLASTALAFVASAFFISTPAHAAEPLLEKQDLFEAGKDGYALYRIPGMVVTAKGTVLAYCEARKAAKGDWGPIDVLMRRSTDGGKTFAAPKAIVEVKGELPVNPLAAAQNLDKPGDNTVNNAVAFVDHKTGAVHFLYCLEYMRCFYMRSDDDGVTWTEAVDITDTFEKFRGDYDWKILATGPAHGIQLKTGRLVVPVWLSTGTGGHAHRPSVTSTIYSDDHGKTWQRGDIAVPNTDEWIFPNETVIVELVNGMVMLNVRSESKKHRRIVVFSKDGATKWSKPRYDEALLEPICMGSIVRYSGKPEGDKNRILFANPHNLDRLDGKAEEGKSRDRRNLSIKLSYDEGKTWAVSKPLEPGYGAYSDLAVLPDGTALCLYERGQTSDEQLKKSTSYAYLTLARFNLEWLTDGKDTLPASLDGKSNYGAKREDFKLGDFEAFVIHPTKPAANGTKPWVWYAPSIGNHPSTGNAWLLKQLLDKGFYVVGAYVGETFANPKSREQFDVLYKHVTKEYGLAPKACLLAQSRGGLNQYNFAANHPDRVQCIAGIFPVGDLSSYPGLKRAAPAYGVTPEELEKQLTQHNPIDRLEPIAKAKIPVLHVHGDADKVVPLEKNSAVIAERYKALGGPMELIIVPGKGHQSDPAFFESEPILKFLLKQGLGTAE
ncbi:MAG TPA: exo-alpha-sialidase [Candidatus Saccharimonadia bacterium]|nr:exo-alpha-sialidase [Candidatus Saccharimonadia bacterium]